MNIPIFVPHVGCPNSCAFCNQHSITGVNDVPTIDRLHRTVEDYLSGGREGKHTIAFFGGSFTGIEPRLQEEYLSAAAEYVRQGRVSGIRLSTRPDYIDDERLDLLEKYGVTNIELGAQSMDDDVLRSSGRGHDHYAVERASELIRRRGFTLGLQMMTGLPLDTREKSIFTAKEFVRLGAEETRIYPTLVMKDTELERRFQRGEYRPQSVEEAVELCAEVYGIFRHSGVTVLRIGLSDSMELKGGCAAGPYHPAMGELVIGRYIRFQLENAVENKSLKITAPKKYLSKIIGNKKCNELYFRSKGIDFTLSEGSEAIVNGKFPLNI